VLARNLLHYTIVSAPPPQYGGQKAIDTVRIDINYYSW